MTRLEFSKRVESVAEDAAGLLQELINAEDEELSCALPSLCGLAEKVSEAETSSLHSLVVRVLISTTLTRSDRKAALAVLESCPLPSNNEDIVQILEALEEPQMHIVAPFLGRFRILVAAASGGKLEFSWLEAVVLRALSHTNGWLRLWAAETILEMPIQLLNANYQILLKRLLPSLSASDLLWRLLDKGGLDSFFTRLSEIMKALSSSRDFVVGFLGCMADITCPLAVFHLSRCLKSFASSNVLRCNLDSQLMRAGVLRVCRAGQLQLRRETAANLFACCSSLISLSQDDILEVVRLFGSLCRLVGGLRPGELAAVVARCIQQKIIFVFDEKQLLKNSLLLLQETMIYEDEWVILLGCRFETEAFLKIDKLAAEVCPSSRPAILLARVLHSSNSSVPSEHFEDAFLNILEMPRLLNKHSCQLLIHSLRTCSSFNEIGRRLFSPKQEWNPDVFSAVTRFEVACFLLEDLKWHPKESQGLSAYELLQIPPLFQPLDLRIPADLDRSSRQDLIERIECARIRLLYASDRAVAGRGDRDSLLDEAIDRLDCAVLYEYKAALAKLLCSLAESATEEDALRTLVALENFSSEQRKSAKYLPSVALLLEFAGVCVARKILTQKILELFGRLLEESSLNTSVAVLLTKSLRFPLQPECFYPFIPIFVELSIFGPIPKKEIGVLHDAMATVNGSEESKTEEETRLDECTWRARLYEISFLRYLGLRDESALSLIVSATVDVIAQWDKSSSRSFGLSMAHRKKTRAVALLLLLSDSRFAPADMSLLWSRGVAWLTDPCQQFSIKLAVEWLLCSFALRDEEYKQRLLSLDEQMASARIGSVASWINIIVLFSRCVQDSSRRELLERILPWCSAQNFAVRCTAVAAARLLVPSGKGDESNSDDGSVYQLARSIAFFDRERTGNAQRVVSQLCSDFYFGHVHPQRDLCVETVLSLLPSRTGLPPDECLPVRLQEEFAFHFDSIPVAISNESLAQASSHTYNNLEKNSSCAPQLNGDEDSIPAGDAGDENITAQKKAITTSDRSEDSNARSARPASLLVVASFIDKAANLGGLCRTCEIFSVDSLLVSDLSLVSENNFRALSMSAENWQQIQELRTDRLLEFVSEKRREGYRIVAAEQASDSVPLHGYRFPEKTVLIMGDERKGVPVWLLRVVDEIVHVEQLGRVRSLNVHVTAALFITKFAEQHLITTLPTSNS